MIQIEFNDGGLQQKISSVIDLLHDGRPLYQRISGALEAETEANFAAQGRPDWVPLADATKKRRLARNKGSSVLKILQDRGILAASVSSDYGADYSVIGAGGAASDYAAIQQLGGTIDMPARSTKVRLRTNAKGDLVRQGTEGSAKGRAVFAKDTHKRARESWHTVEAYSITIPAREYLPFTMSGGSPQLQPEAEVAVLDIVTRLLGESLD
jgi:phage virion morphogenesis protein